MVVTTVGIGPFAGVLGKLWSEAIAAVILGQSDYPRPQRDGETVGRAERPLASAGWE
jgi:hypothetical protein